MIRPQAAGASLVSTLRGGAGVFSVTGKASLGVAGDVDNATLNFVDTAGKPGTGGCPGVAGCAGSAGATGLGFDGSRSRTSMLPSERVITTFSAVITFTVPPAIASPIR